MNYDNHLLPGMILTIFISALSFLLWQFYPSISTLMWSFIFSIILTNIITIPKSMINGINFSSTILLKTAIVMYGLIISPLIWVQVGFVFPIIVIMVLLIFFIAIKLGQKFGLSDELSTLIGIGTCICGASAIAATAPAIKAKDEEIGTALATITIFGLISMFLYPFLYYSGLQGILGSETAYGLWVGLGVHDTAGVIAAASQISSNTVNTSLTFKSIRIFMIGPMIILSTFLINKKNEKSYSTPKLFIPTYAILFVVASLFSGLFDLANQYNYTYLLIRDWVLIKDLLSKYFLPFVLGTAFAGVGMKVKFSNIKKIGAKSFLIGIIIAFIASLFAFIVTLVITNFL